MTSDGVRMRELFSVVSVWGLSIVGYFKGTALLKWLPGDATLVFAAMACVVVLLRWTTGGRGAAGGNRVLPLLVVLWTSFSLGGISAVAIGLPLAKTFYLATITLIAWWAAALLLWTPSVARLWLGLQVGGGVVMALLLLVGADAEAQSTFGRTVLEGGNSIGSGRVLGAALLVVALSAIVPRTSPDQVVSSRVLRWALLLSLSVALLSVGSRGPVVAVMASLAAALVMPALRDGAGWRRIPVAASLLAVGIVGLLLVPSGARARILGVFDSDVDGSGREEIYKTAWMMVQETPAGLGWGGYAQTLGLNREFGSSPPHPHNLTLEVLLEAGWFPGLVFIATVGCVLAVGYRSRTPYAPYFFALFVFWLVNAHFSADINGNRMLFASAIAMGAAMCRRKEDSGPRG